MKYIDSEKLLAELTRMQFDLNAAYRHPQSDSIVRAISLEYDDILSLVDSLQQDQPIEGKQVVIITETDGDANIHWDCRSLDDVKALLTSAQSFIADKQVEELRRKGSGPDYNTTEGRFRNAHKFQQEQPEVDLAKEIKNYLATKCAGDDEPSVSEIARHFYELGLNTRKEETK